MTESSNESTAAPSLQPFHAPEPTLRDYLRVVSTRRWLVLGIFLVVVIVTGVWVFTQTPIYRPHALLQIAPAKPALAPFPGVYDETLLTGTPKHDFLETQVKLIVAERLVEQTYSYFGIGELRDFRDRKDPFRAFKDLFAVHPIRRTWLVEVTFDWPDPELGARMLDYHVARYADDYAQRKQARAAKGLVILEEQRKRLSPRVEQARRSLQEFKEQHNMIAFERVHDTIAEDLMGRQKAVGDARRKLTECQTRLEQVEVTIRSKTPVGNLPDVLESSLIMDYRKQKLACEQDLRDGLKRFGEKHPEIKGLRAKLDLVIENIDIEIQRVVDALRNEHAQAKKLLALSIKELETQEKAVQEFNRLKLQYDALKSEFDNQDKVYLAVVKRIEQIKVTEGALGKGDTITIERRPKPEKRPAKPRRALIMALACLLGLAFSVGTAFLLDNLDTTLKNKDDVSRYLGLSLLGYVPEIPELQSAKRKQSRVAVAMLRHPRSAVAEAFRSIRTALSFSVAAQDVSHIMVTSASPSEGKTLVAANIAAALAQAGKRTLLVDADMRRPSVHKVFEVEQSPGLTNLLVGEGVSSLEDVIRPSELPNLYFIPSGPVPPNPAEIIGCDRMRTLLAQMVAQFDRVIIDTPPVVNVTDAAVLCNAAHGVVLVVRSFRTLRELARRAVEVLANSGGRLLGVVLNNVDVPRGAYYYDSYYYYQQYYYYGEDGAKKQRRKKRERDTNKATA